MRSTLIAETWVDPRRIKRRRFYRDYSFDTPTSVRTNAGMRTETIELRVTADEKTASRDAAKRAGLALSAWSPMRLLRAAGAATV
jgi:hypothetical protein